MYEPISDFMSNWLNKTYEYLKETGGPTYPPKPITVGAGVLPTGGYSLVEDVGITEIPITQYGNVPLAFNPSTTSPVVIASSRIDTADKIAKENLPPLVFSNNFQRLYSNLGINACIADQMHGQGNPNARSACQKLANMGDPSEMILNPTQKEALGLTPEQITKSAKVLLAEEKASLTGQMKTGIQEGFAAWKGFTLGAGALVKRDPSGNNFQSLNDRLKAFIPGMPAIPDLNSPVVMIGGAVIGVVLLIAIVK